MTPFDIHLVTWNRPKMTDLVIKTIVANTKPGTYRLNVLDNCSDEETLTVLKNNKRHIDEVFYLGENIGLEGARQWLFQDCSNSPYFVCVDNDCLAPKMKDGKDWLERLYELAQRHPDYAAIACRTQVMIGTGNIFEGVESELTDFPHPGGSFRMMLTDAVGAVGGWDRQALGRGSEERYICGKLYDAGYKTAFATDIDCLHLFGTQDTDNWGYGKKMKPEDSGHSNIWHPKFQEGDVKEEVLLYATKKDTERYFNGHSDNQA